jgi:spore coat polysaccharide biosynthesis protein SpsF (cytidylyltransferase family)
MSSTRLPGKVLMPLADEPGLVRMMQRVARVRMADQRLVATSTDPSDDAVVEVCQRHGITCVRGPLDDVLGRFLDALPPTCDVVVRLTGDCPLVDPAIVDRHIGAFLSADPEVDYVTNGVRRTMPDGLDVEVLSRRVLERAGREAIDSADREHVTPWVQRHARMLPVVQEVDLSELCWTVDSNRDYEFVAAVYDELHSIAASFGSSDVYRLLVRCPELIHVKGTERITDRQRATWCARIELHLAHLNEAEHE